MASPPTESSWTHGDALTVDQGDSARSRGCSGAGASHRWGTWRLWLSAAPTVTAHHAYAYDATNVNTASVDTKGDPSGSHLDAAW